MDDEEEAKAELRRIRRSWALLVLRNHWVQVRAAQRRGRLIGRRLAVPVNRREK